MHSNTYAVRQAANHFFIFNYTSFQKIPIPSPISIFANLTHAIYDFSARGIPSPFRQIYRAPHRPLFQNWCDQQIIPDHKLVRHFCACGLWKHIGHRTQNRLACTPAVLQCPPQQRHIALTQRHGLLYLFILSARKYAPRCGRELHHRHQTSELRPAYHQFVIQPFLMIEIAVFATANHVRTQKTDALSGFAQ